MDNLVTLVLRILNEAGLHARRAFVPARLPRLKSQMIVGSSEKIRVLPCSYDSVLGLRLGENVYGREVEFEIRLDVYGPESDGGSACMHTVYAAVQAIAERRTSYTLRQILIDPLRYDADCDCFCSSIHLTFGGLLSNT